jgi:predicted O-linked N-acetylglucosamine transferase (SPINDLY family)
MAAGSRRGYRILRSLIVRAQNALITRSTFIAPILASPEHRQKLKQYETARLNARRILAAEPSNRDAWTKLGDALRGLGRHREAIACYERALMFAPENKLLWQKRAITIETLGKKVSLPDAAINPRDADSWVLRAGALAAQKRFADAAEACDKALKLDPAHVQAMRIGIRSRLRACDWRKREDDKLRIASGLGEGRVLVAPLTHRRLSDSEEDNLILGRLQAPPPDPIALWRGEIYRHDRVRLAYICAEYCEHAIAFALAGVFEHHDRQRFELYAISLGKDDDSQMRQRIEAAFDHFVDAQAMDDAGIARFIRDREIDIAVDISSFAGDGRLGILSRRPAPIQVNYLAYPGTIGAPYFDYIIADQTVIPSWNCVHYSEQVVYLPHTYQPTDNKNPVSENAPSRSEAGLPESGFVFACFNQEPKFSPEVFAVWMRILLAVEGSVLWLLSINRQAADNLRREAQSRGVAPERLIFAPPVQRDRHLARIRLADLFLDTLPYNAHATACDALWAGLPVLTCLGKAFPGRVAASGLYAVGLPELVTASLAEYEALAVSLAHDRARLAAIREKLSRNRGSEPLFDTARYTRNLEAAYATMCERLQNGMPPASFSVNDCAHRAPQEG